MKIVAFTGAGISKSAGIPTFEDTPGIKEKFSVEYRDKHPNEFQKLWEERKQMLEGKEPTKAHYALAEFQIPIITMNIDNLHKKAGSRVVLTIHGNVTHNNIVLYGEDINFREESINLIINTANEAKKYNEESMFLVVGTSMQTTFANILVWLAEDRGMKVQYINENADEEVPKLLHKLFFQKNN